MAGRRAPLLAGVGVAAVLVALAPSLIGWATELPYFGVGLEPTAQGSLRVVGVDPESTGAAVGLERGDLLLSVGGIEPRMETPRAAGRILQLEVTNRYGVGEAARWVFEREGEVRSVEAAFRPVSITPLFTSLVVHLVFWIVAFGLLVMRPGEPVVRVLLFAVLAGTAAWFFSPAADVPLDDPLGFALQQVFATGRFLAPALVVHFGLLFPSVTVSARTRRWTLALAYGVTGGLFLVEQGVLLRGALHPELPYLVYTGWLSTLRYQELRFWVYIGAYVAAAGLLLQSYRRLADRKQRAQIQWIFWAFLLVAAWEAILTVVAPRFGLTVTRAVLQPWIDVSYLLIAAALLTAILRHDLFDIDTVIRKTALYFGTMALLFLVFTALENAISVAFQERFAEQPGMLAALVSGMIAAVLFLPVRVWMQRLIGVVLPPDLPRRQAH